jgi:adenine-specific DNA methylase
MIDNNPISKAENRSKKLKIQSQLPLRTVGIETERERKNFTHLPPQNYLHIWWARRPTPATRLAILSSILPDSVDDDTLLSWMCIDPDNKLPEDSVAEHVRKKKESVDDRDGLVYEHYGYRKMWTQTPDKETINSIQEIAKETWGEVPTVLDATAGGGSIPFESVRYEFPTIANELNPVASVLLEAVLELPRVNGDLSSDIEKWGNEINRRARGKLSDYFPDPSENEKSLARLWAHTISCPDCGLDLPLAPNWWLKKESSSEGQAAHASVVDEQVEFDMVRLSEDVTKEEFDPTNGTVSYGKGECLRCGVTIEGDEVKSQARDGEFDLALYGVEVEVRAGQEEGKRKYITPYQDELAAVERAKETVENDPDLAGFLTEERFIGPADRALNYGMEKWRDAFAPRQLLSHYKYLEAYEEVKEEIKEEYSDDESEVLLTFLAIAADKALDYNSKFSFWDSSVPKVAHTFERHDFSFKWNFAETNMPVEDLGYDWYLEQIVGAYEDLYELSGQSTADTEVLQGDASNLDLDNESIEAIVLDPPYYDNVMYAELSDFFYVWMKKYLGDTYPEFFNQELTDKQSEAIANPAKFKDVAGNGQSKSELAKQDYESKMTDIFSEMNRVLESDGIFTLMFTHKKTEAWDTLTKALIESGFVVTATHPVSTENPHSLHQAGKNSAESTILLSSEKRDSESDGYTLWSEIQSKTREVAQKKAKELNEGDVDFAKVDVILASFGPTLEVFTEEYPVVDDEGNEVTPQTALDEARTAVRDYFIDRYLNEGVRVLDPKSEWYIISWLVFEAKRFPYDEARRLAIGIGEDLDDLKRPHRMWRKQSGDVVLRSHEERVQAVNKDPNDRSSRKPVDPDALSFSTALDKVHAAIHIYQSIGATEAWNWMNDRNCGSDPAFKATLEGLLRVLPHNQDDWDIARDMAAGETGDLLDLELEADIFRDDGDENDEYQGNLHDF